jgi:A/G-specific adenine glycosylase
MTQQRLNELILPLLSWYEKNARVLPWRKDPTPYHVWVSEIMLQQTRVEAGRGYYIRFVETLKDVESLANVTEEQLMKLWEGLGYYSRARNLKKAAGIVMEQYGGVIPGDFEGLISLPGIGPYTAGAIGSIAFGLPLPAVDGNVLRVIARVLASQDNIGDQKTKGWMEKELATVIPENRPGDFNQALMELGATICLPNGAPKCESCPIIDFCRANAEGLERELPVKAPKKARRIEERTILILWMSDKILLKKRGATGLLSGMWELPSLDGCRTSEEVRRQLEEMGFRCEDIEPLPAAKHIFSHVEWHMTAYRVNLHEDHRYPLELREKEATEYITKDNRKLEAEWIFISQKELTDQVALPSAFNPFRQYLF